MLPTYADHNIKAHFGTNDPLFQLKVGLSVGPSKTVLKIAIISVDYIDQGRTSWPLAAREQEARLEDDPWTEILAAVEKFSCVVNADGHHRVKTTDLFGTILEIPKERQQNYHSKRLAGIMRKLGWEGPSLLRFGDKVARGYQRPIEHAANE